MILRITQKLGKKIKVIPSECLPPDKNPFADWSAHIFTAERVQHIILTNTQSLFSVVMYGRGIADQAKFTEQALNCLHEFMTAEGLESLYHLCVLPDTTTVLYSRIGNRHVLGSMNDLISQAKMDIVEGGRELYDVAVRLNETPLSMLDYGHPRKAFLSMVSEEFAAASSDLRFITGKTLEQIEYRGGMFERGKTPESLPLQVWRGAEITAGMRDAIIRDGLLNLGGTYGNKWAGDPIQYDHLKLVLTDKTVEITVFNRAIALFLTNDERIRHIHRALCKLVER